MLETLLEVLQLVQHTVQLVVLAEVLEGMEPDAKGGLGGGGWSDVFY